MLAFYNALHGLKRVSLYFLHWMSSRAIKGQLGLLNNKFPARHNTEFESFIPSFASVSLKKGTMKETL